MKTIEIDSDIFTYLQNHARPFIDTPNSTLRRLLKIDMKLAVPTEQKIALSNDVELEKLLEEGLAIQASKRKKAPKADLRTLVREGILKDGEQLHFVDYQRNSIDGVVAVISNNGLIYNSKFYSMSSLAEELLKAEGYNSNAVRGPEHWITKSGKSIKELWQYHLNKLIDDRS